MSKGFDGHALYYGMEQLDTTYPWTLAVGAWGDCLCAYGNICKLVKERGIEKANVVYFGLDGNINDFFKAQPNINKVSWLKISLPRVINKYIRLASTDFKQFLEVTELDKQLPDLVPTHISDYYEVQHPTECYRDFTVELPPDKGNWQSFLGDAPYILFQPFSAQSCDYCYHWPHWKEALDWLVDNTKLRIVMAGELPREGSDAPNWFPLPEEHKDRITNIVGQTKCMTDLLHIADKAKAIVTTANALSIWSVLRKVPCLVACHKIIKLQSPYYYNWIQHYPNTVLDYEDGLEAFRSSFGFLFPEG